MSVPMNQNHINALFALLRSVICEKKLKDEELDYYSNEMIQDLLKISSKHDIAHLVAFGLKQNELITKENIEIENHIFKAIYRYELFKREYDNLCNAFEKAKIPFMPLKGAVIRNYYPEAWMRTSSDIDVLVHEEDLEKAKSVLVSECGYSYKGKCTYEISFVASNSVHIELHYNLVTGGYTNKVLGVQKDVWRNAKVREGYSFFYELTDEMFFFYHISHMAKHFVFGGCGIRFFIDLFILDNIQQANKEKRDIFLKKGNLLKFAEASRRLSRVWFDNGEYDLVTKQMEEYIIYGGIYGNMKNRTLVQQRKGYRIKRTLSRIFLPYDVIKFYYPVLQKHPWLTPVIEVYRWLTKLLSFIFPQKSKKSPQYNKNITNEDTQNIQFLLDSIGL